MAKGLVSSTHARTARRRAGRRWVGRALVGAVAVFIVASVLIVPGALTKRGTEDARACLANYSLPRGPVPPDCGGLVSLFSLPSRIPWTRTNATRRAEELRARIALAEYVDAAVGHPDPDTQARAVAPLALAEQLVKSGSGRLVLEDLGRAVPSPRLGHQAALLGDRRTLTERYEQWSYWHVRLHALESALIEGRLEVALAMAKRYAEFDPRDADVRVAVGAVLCLTGAPIEGLAILDRVPADRAEGRHANFARHFGEVWMLIEACSGLAGRVPPDMPPTTSAGVADASEARAVQRIRLSLERDKQLARSLDYAEVLLSSLPAPEGPGLAPTARGARAALLSGLIAHADDLTPAAAADLAKPRTADEESGLGPGRLLSAEDLWRAARGLHHPEQSPDTLVRAAERMIAWTKAEDDDGDRLVASEKVRRTLRQSAGELYLRAAVHEARAGQAASSAALFVRGGELTSRPAIATGIAVAAAHRLAGDPQRALKELLDAPPPKDEPPKDNPSAVHRAAWLQQNAEVLLVLGRLDEARTRAAQADEAAEQAGDPALALRARWTRLVLATEREHAIRDAAPSPTNAFLHVGYADRDTRWARPGHHASLSALTAWRDAIFAQPEQQLALRYAVLDVRGDGVDAFLAQLVAATRLLGVHDREVAAARSPAIEVWLDAFTAIDAKRMSMRAYAWSRAEAARARGDTKAAKRWAEAQAKLAEISRDPARAEIARYLRL